MNNAQRLHKAAQLAGIASISLLAAAVSVSNAEMSGTDASQFTRASELIGKQVENTQDEDLGEVVDIAFDRSTGEVAYVVVTSKKSGLFNRTPKNFVAIPLNRLNQPAAADDDDDEVILDASREAFAAAPTFDKDNWPQRATFMVDSGSTTETGMLNRGVATESNASADSSTSTSSEAVNGMTTDADPDLTGTTTAAPAGVMGSASDNELTDDPGVNAITDDETTGGTMSVIKFESPEIQNGTEQAGDEQSDAIEDADDVPSTVSADDQPMDVEAVDTTDVSTSSPAAASENDTFNKMDTDTDGYLTQTELSEQMANASSTIQDNDTNADGKLDRAEFAAVAQAEAIRDAQENPRGHNQPESSDDAERDVTDEVNID